MPAHLAWQMSQVEGADPATALRLFRSNRDAGLMLFAGCRDAGVAGVAAPGGPSGIDVGVAPTGSARID